ncbi:MAG: glycosyltransferase family 4 protein [Gemmatimonadetes bacterium]|nr:glycosyltransferase family 4 protein [Gemmatimonadota bacterium]
MTTARRRRVLLVGPVPPPMDGRARYLQDLTSSALAERHDLVLLADNVPEHLRPRVNTERFTWNVLRRDGVMSSASVLAFVARKMVELRRRLVRDGVEIVHLMSTTGYGFFRNTVHSLIAKRSGARTVSHLLGQFDDFYRDAGPWMKRLIRWSLDKADVHIVQSPGLADVLRTMTGRPIYSIVNGVRIEDFRPPEGFAHSDGQAVRVLTVGYLGHRKGTFDLLEVAERLSATRPKVRLTVVGGGEVDRFRGLAEQRKLRNIEFIGAVDEMRKVALLHGADIFLLPSRAEGQPIALLEAIAAGLPVVSTTVGSIPEVVGSANGLLTSPGDVEGMVSVLERLVDDPSLRERMGRFNRQDAVRRFDLRRVFDEIDAVYQAI